MSRREFVIARNTAFTYKGRKLDLRQVGRELGVRYLLEGSVRKAGNRVRITGQLIEAETGTHLWADRFDGALEDVFDLQDRVTASVTGVIEPSVAKAEIERARRKPPSSLAAYDLLLKALDAQWPWSPENIKAALSLARAAIKLEPEYALALSYVANWLAYRKVLDDASDLESEAEEAIAAAHKAVRIDPDDPMVLARSAYGIRIMAGEIETALEWLERALSINPNSASVLAQSAIIRNHAGDYAIAEEQADRAARLSPYDPLASVFDLARGMSHLMRRNLTEAIEFLQSRRERTLPTSTRSISRARWAMPAGSTRPGRP